MRIDFITSIINLVSAIILLSVAMLAILQGIKNKQLTGSEKLDKRIDKRELIIIFLFSISVGARLIWNENVEFVIKGILVISFGTIFFIKKEKFGRTEILMLVIVVFIFSISSVQFLYDKAIKGIVENQRKIIEVQEEVIKIQYDLARLLEK